VHLSVVFDVVIKSRSNGFRLYISDTCGWSGVKGLPSTLIFKPILNHNISYKQRGSRDGSCKCSCITWSTGTSSTDIRVTDIRVPQASTGAAQGEDIGQSQEVLKVAHYKKSMLIQRIKI
jgi:hypothetical protein